MSKKSAKKKIKKLKRQVKEARRVLGLVQYYLEIKCGVTNPNLECRKNPPKHPWED